MNKVVIVFDDISKRSVKLDRSVLNAKDITICNNISELSSLNKEDEVIAITFEYLARTPEYSLFMPLFKEYSNIRFICLCNSEEVTNFASKYCEVFRCDLSLIDFELIQAAIYNDTVFNAESFDSYAETLKKAENLIEAKISVDVEEVARDFIACDRRKNELADEVTKLNTELKKVTQQKDILLSENNKWSNGCKKLVERAKKQAEVLKQYETILSKDIYTKLNINDYNKRPEIIYLKVFRDFKDLDLFIETLVDVLRIQKQKSVKVVRLYDNSGCRDMKLVPKYYTLLRNHYRVDQIVSNDYLVKSGDYFNLMDRVLSNKYNLDTLIILDFKDFDDVILRGTYTSFSLCDTAEHAKVFGLNPNFTVIGEKVDNWFVWESVNIKELSKDDAFIKLSSSEAIKAIIEMSDKIRTSF